MPSQLWWKPGYESMLACMGAHFWNLTQHLPNPGFCAFLMWGEVYGYGDRGGLGPALR